MSIVVIETNKCFQDNADCMMMDLRIIHEKRLRILKKKKKKFNNRNR